MMMLLCDYPHTLALLVPLLRLFSSMPIPTYFFFFFQITLYIGPLFFGFCCMDRRLAAAAGGGTT